MFTSVWATVQTLACLGMIVEFVNEFSVRRKHAKGCVTYAVTSLGHLSHHLIVFCAFVLLWDVFSEIYTK